jgi:hypothetical protein
MSTPCITTEFDPTTRTVTVIIKSSTGATVQIPLAKDEVDEFLDDLSFTLNLVRILTKE